MKSASAAFVLVLVIGVEQLLAGPVQWLPEANGNGHYYDLVRAPGSTISWTQADYVAENMSLLGTAGHLATVTSREENDFLMNTFTWGWDHAWLGLTRNYASGGWMWVTGEEYDYSNWAPGEPNNWGGTEDYVHYNGADTYLHGDRAQKWNDFPNLPDPLNVTHFLVEYPVAVAVPEPSAIALLSVGAMACLAFRWRRKRTSPSGP